MDDMSVEKILKDNLQIALQLLGIKSSIVKVAFDYGNGGPERLAGQYDRQKNEIVFFVKVIQTFRPVDMYAAYVAFHEARHLYQRICKTLFAADIAPEDYREYRRLHDAHQGSAEGVFAPRELDADAFAGKMVFLLYGFNLWIMADRKEAMLPYLDNINRHFAEKANKIKTSVI